MSYLTHLPFATAVCCTFCFNLCVANAEIYKTVDKDGKVIYTDNPQDKSATAVKLPPPNIQAAPVKPSSTSSAEEEAEEAVDYQLAISTPADQQQIPPGQRDLTISASVQPELDPKHQLQILVNGQVQPLAGTSTTLTNIHRGTHRIQARILNTQGKSMATSTTVTVYVHRPTVAK